MTDIYALIDPLTQELRYVGKGASAEGRRKSHVRNARNHPEKRLHVADWIRSLLSQGCEPEVEVLEVVPGDGCEEERFWIAYFRSIGCDLTNHTMGGDGIPGYRFTEEQRAKMHGTRSPETRRRISEGHRGQRAWNKGLPRDSEVTTRITAKLRGRKHPPDCGHCAGVRAAALRGSYRGRPQSLIGRPHTEAAKAKMSATKRAKQARRLSPQPPPEQQPLQ